MGSEPNLCCSILKFVGCWEGEFCPEFMSWKKN
jgi:hypothetical protein